MERWLKAELHAHTSEDPVDGGRVVLHSAKQLIDQAGRQGFEVLSITNHDQMLATGPLQDYARRKGVLLIPGVEATLGGKHALLYNFPGYTPDWRDLATVLREKGPGQMVIAPHPFFPASTALGKVFLEWSSVFDAVEYNHFYLSWLNFNRRAQFEAFRLKLPLVGNSDVHDLAQLGRTSSLIYAEKEPASVIRAVKQGRVRVVTRPLGAAFVARWLLRTGGLTLQSRVRRAVLPRLARLTDPAFRLGGQPAAARRR